MQNDRKHILGSSKKWLPMLPLLLAVGIGVYCLVQANRVALRQDPGNRVALALPEVDAADLAQDASRGYMQFWVCCNGSFTLEDDRGQTLTVDPESGLSGDLPAYAATRSQLYYSPWCPAGKESYDFVLIVSTGDAFTVDFGGRSGRITMMHTDDIDGVERDWAYEGYAASVSGKHMGRVTLFEDEQVEITDNSLFGQQYEIAFDNLRRHDAALSAWISTGRIRGTQRVSVESDIALRFQGDCKKWKCQTFDNENMESRKGTVTVPVPEGVVAYYRQFVAQEAAE